jgi:hypothetical protein
MGENVRIECRWAHGRFDQLAIFAAELVAERVAVVVQARLGDRASRDPARWAGDERLSRVGRSTPLDMTGKESPRQKIFCWTRVTRIFQKSVFTEITFGSPFLAKSGHKSTYRLSRVGRV